jgi:hypothetical protein
MHQMSVNPEMKQVGILVQVGSGISYARNSEKVLAGGDFREYDSPVLWD